jgi:hypothetical protein
MAIDADRQQQDHDQSMVKIDLLRQALRQGEERIRNLEVRERAQDLVISKLWETMLDVKCRTLKVRALLVFPHETLTMFLDAVRLVPERGGFHRESFRVGQR